MVRTSLEAYDIRVSQKLLDLFSERKGWWFMVNRKKAQKVVDILSEIYEIDPPEVRVSQSYLRKLRANGLYGSGIVYMYNFNHVKTILHEWYHHLDDMTAGEYDSSSISEIFKRGVKRDQAIACEVHLAWIFAELLWLKVLRKEIGDFLISNEDSYLLMGESGSRIGGIK